MNLVVDIGNSLIKLAVFQNDKLLKKKVIMKTDFKKTFEELKFSFPQIGQIMISSVSNTEIPALKKLEKKHRVVYLTQELELPFKNLYTTPNTLGKDRIALVAAASKFFKNQNVLVIDAGTCLTFDFLNSENEYFGGAISPGLKMRFRALHNFTDKLPLLEPDEDAPLFGNSTKSAINSGVVNGMANEIDGVIKDYTVKYPDLKIVFTGGDQQFLSERLKSSIFANSNFLLEGLNYLLEINNNK